MLSEKSSPTKRKSSTRKRKSSPTKRKSSPTKRKSSPTKRKSSTRKRKSSPTKRKSSPTKRKSSPKYKKPIPLDKELYKKAKKMADKVYDRPSAYKSGYIVKQYKAMGGKYSGDKKKSDLKRWFNEEWTDVNPFANEKSYPVYRPTKRITKDTPLTLDEIDCNDLVRKSKKKQKYREKRKLEKFKSKQL
jgi:hypothetical protein